MTLEPAVHEPGQPACSRFRSGCVTFTLFPGGVHGFMGDEFVQRDTAAGASVSRWASAVGPRLATRSPACRRVPAGRPPSWLPNVLTAVPSMWVLSAGLTPLPQAARLAE